MCPPALSRLLGFLFLLSFSGGCAFSLSALGPERPADFSWQPSRDFALRSPGRLSGGASAASMFPSSFGVDSLGSSGMPAAFFPTPEIGDAGSDGPFPGPPSGADFRPLFSPLPVAFTRSPLDPFPLAGMAPVLLWDGGGIVASGSSVAYPGLMGVESGSLVFTQSLGNVSFTLAGSADKYAGFRSLTTRYTLSGAVGWQIAPRLSLHAFGSYSPGSPYSSPGVWPGMGGYMSTTNFGGYLSVDFSGRFGMDVGGQGYYNMATGRWEARPIVQPYVRLDNGAKLGVDLGGILYGILSNTGLGNRLWGSGNPTIPPPAGPVAPPPPRVR